MVDKVALGQVSSEYFGFPCQFSFHRKFSILIITRGRYNRTVNGRGAEWTQFGLHPPLYANKKINIYNSLRSYRPLSIRERKNNTSHPLGCGSRVK
jgi:hypothetical protein